jgi:hypothetical protein
VVLESTSADTTDVVWVPSIIANEEALDHNQEQQLGGGLGFNIGGASS